MTTDWQAVVNDPEVDVVAELAGGTTIARTMILTALQLGKPVVTANKALLSAHGRRAVRRGAEARDQPLLRGQRLRRHPDHQGAARGLCGQPHYPSLRHRQRHLQLHPHPDEAGGGGFRRRCSRTPRRRVTPRPSPRSTWMGTTPCTRSASSPRWRTASGSTPRTFTWRASAALRRRTFNSPTSSATRSSCWGSSRRRRAEG